jgi:glycosyltransferase involved in cell wall biosynthesis
MKIALVSVKDDASDPQSWSGIPWHLAEALRAVDDVELVVVGPPAIPTRHVEALRKAWYRLQGQRYVWWREPRIMRRWSRDVARSFEGLDVDAVLALGTVSSSCVPDGVRHAIYTDSTWETNLDYYPTMTGVCGRSRRISEALEQQAYQRVDQVVITSDWAKDSVVGHYGVDAERVTVAPIGANTVCDLSADELRAHAERRLSGPMKLFWIGVEWERKGGDTAVAAAEELHRRGVPVELHLAGRYPELEPRPWLHEHGFLNFTTDRARAQAIFLDSYMLLLPTIAEDAGIVFAEAAGFAVPSIAPGTGGVPTMVADGINGVLLEEAAPFVAYADALEALWRDPDRYLRLAVSSRERFERELTWGSVASLLVQRLRVVAGDPA